MGRRRESFDFEAAVERALDEAGSEHAEVTPDPHALPLDGLRLRGIPVIGGRGSMGGAIPGTRPDQLSERSAAQMAADFDVVSADTAAAQRDEETIAEVENRKPRKIDPVTRPIPVSWLVGFNEVAPLWGESAGEWQRETQGMLLDVFDGEIASRTRATTVPEQETFVCMLGNIPPAELVARTSLGTLTSGFAGRWVIVPSPGPETPISFPRLNGSNPLAGLAEIIRHISRMAKRSEPLDVGYLWPEGGPAEKERDEWYVRLWSELRKVDPHDAQEAARGDLFQRLQATALKLATHLAICREAGRLDHLADVRVRVEDARWAHELVDRSISSLMEIVAEGGGDTTNPLGKVENRVLSCLRRAEAWGPESALEVRTVTDRAKGHGASRGDVIRALENLSGAGAVEIPDIPPGGRGRPGRIVWLAVSENGAQ